MPARDIEFFRRLRSAYSQPVTFRSGALQELLEEVEEWGEVGEKWALDCGGGPGVEGGWDG